ncbi:MAG: Tat (twin-arginine translocation) pathway signal sequence containing protein [Flavobacteriaceae bacterium]|nr:Tat (twin-arginine translocation) pathway signal sequence containing protein [Flavobacteriaceae bacterium]|tara:strand:+ start:1128 stop:1799 length:672 start_codon:yes stop_codon:yes gene_type:complete
MKPDRRKFFTSIALGVGATAFPNFIKDFDNLEPVSLETQIKSNELNNWFDNIKGEHRVVYDGSEPHNTLPITWNWAFLESNNSVGEKDDNITAMTVLRHSGIVFAFNSDIWKKFKLGELVSFNDNKTGSPALRNTVYEPQEGDMPLPPIQGIKDLQARGSLFCVCDLATKVYGSAVAKKMNLNPDDVYSEMVEGILPGIQLVPSGVWALGRAQNMNCAYIFAG